MKNGEVRLTDDDGEEYHVEMRHDQAWPMISRRMRDFEMREAWERHMKELRKPSPPIPFGPPRLVS